MPKMITYKAPCGARVDSANRPVYGYRKMKAHLVEIEGMKLGLQRVKGGYECVHLATGLGLKPLHAIAPWGKAVTLVEAKQNISDMFECFHDLSEKIRNGAKACASRGEIVNPEFMV